MSPIPATRPFEGRTLVVSGASSGLGRAIAVRLGQLGAALVLVGRDRDRLEETERRSSAPHSTIVQLDLRDIDRIVPAIHEIAQSMGRLYGLCHAAGTVETLQFSSTTPAKTRALMDVDYFAGMELARAVARHDVIDSEGGSILFLSSIYSLIGRPGQIAYSGSKGAVRGAARAMAMELARRKIRVNVLSPGMVRTEMTDKALGGLRQDQVKALEALHPLGFGSPEDVAHAAAFLLSPESRWITATDLIVDGGCSAH